MPIPFIDLQAQRRRLGESVDQGMRRVLDHGQFIMGPEVPALETALSTFSGAHHVIGCANGTDALNLAMRALGIGPGDAVIVPAFSFSASAEAVVLVGATPVFCDVRPDSFNIDIASLAAAVDTARQAGLNPRAVMPVDLFGLPADYAALDAAAAAHGMLIIADAAQSFGASRGNRQVGTFGHIAATSFFPSKPLGCYGDGGAVFTPDAETASLLRSLRQHGEGRDRYDNVRIGINSRLDSLQAAVLLAKLSIFAEEIELRQKVAARYNAALADIVEVPVIDSKARSVWAQYTIKLDDRDRVAAGLKAVGVPTAIYYPRSLNHQPAYRDYPIVAGGVPVAEALASQVLSLPFHPYLDEATQDYIVDQLRAVIATA
ncbi:MAG TPA: DegT/DnrJ/EryC1/StrS aminotransferase family protein [Dongiaceae bacterium]|nr:DegT/DnrJ/EryC1/StrS aminotransferase family protein [Dongiaceae bacterium]